MVGILFEINTGYPNTERFFHEIEFAKFLESKHYKKIIDGFYKDDTQEKNVVTVVTDIQEYCKKLSEPEYLFQTLKYINFKEIDDLKDAIK